MHEVRDMESYVGMAILIYTSGITGLPKPAVVLWGKIYTASMMVAKGMSLKGDDIFYIVSPLFPSLHCSNPNQAASACRFTTALLRALALAVFSSLEQLPPSGVGFRPRHSRKRSVRARPSTSCMSERPVST
ncbi:hypothetical protein B0T25DRAFT_228700 [Lasiosphaeria hispida]|uniref:AMP-dependent synthetase/ligase domain-containing protein n=1 Tax=Lasiosphaeria hispida TaxID=260671 RepID=A0AAJ0HDC7_9PEZI|nr:hypothetical protein B0T25DRAFT_228700 [Lasiosphaeria hispida]